MIILPRLSRLWQTAEMFTAISKMPYNFFCQEIWRESSVFSIPRSWHCRFPLPPVHLLFINLLTDSLPAIAIGMEPPERGLLDFPPRNPKKGILTFGFLADILFQGMLIAICTMESYRIGLSHSPGMASTMAFSTLTLARLFHGFNCRSSCSIFRLGVFTNLYTVMAFEAGILLLASVLFIPNLQALFSVADLSRWQLGNVAFYAFLPTGIIQALKVFREQFTCLCKKNQYNEVIQWRQRTL